MNIRSAIVALLLATSTFLPADPPDKAETMPQILQYGLGPGGTALPNDGSEYCGPTAMTMNIAWLGLAGHERLAPTTAAELTQDFFINLDRTLGGLSQADPYGGTTVGGLASGVNTYLAMKGYSGNFTSTTGGLYNSTGNGDGSGPGVTTPTLNDLTAIANNTETDLHFGTFVVGWYVTNSGTWERNGGHFLAIVGTSGSNTLQINNPYPNPGMPAQQTILLSEVPAGISGDDGGPPVYNLGGYLNASEGMQYPVGGTMPAGYATPVIEQWMDFSVPISAPSVATWHLDEGDNYINIGLAHQEVLAPVADSAQGSSSFAFVGRGRLTLTREATYTGGTTVGQATLESTESSGTPFGTGGISLYTSTLVLKPRGSGENVDLHAGGELRFYDGSRLELDLGDHESLTFRVSSFYRSADGTLIIAPKSSGVLGNTVKVLADDEAPGVNAGMVSPAYVGQDGSSSAKSGYFLTYDTNDGLIAATTVTGDINTLSGTPIYSTTSSEHLVATAAVAAIQINHTITGEAGSTLTIGAEGLEGAGVILNGASLGVDTVDFGDQAGYIYTSAEGGAISSNLTGSNTRGVHYFGPGAVTLSGTLAYSGTTNIQNGTVILADNGVISSEGGTVIQGGATFEQNGALSTSGTLTISGTRTGSGNITGDVSVRQYGTFSGAGTITGSTELQGFLTQTVDAEDPTNVLTFNGDLTIEYEGVYNFNLASLSQLDLNDFFQVNGTLTFSEGSQMGIVFNAVDDPTAMNSFWDTNQTFLIASATTISGFDNLTLNALDYSNGYFWIGHNQSEGDIYLHWNAIPEPGTLALIAVGAGRLLAARFRRRG